MQWYLNATQVTCVLTNKLTCQTEPVIHFLVSAAIKWWKVLVSLLRVPHFVKVKTMRLLRHENSQRHIFLKTNYWPYLFPGSSLTGPENHLRFIVTVVAPRYRKHLDGVELVPVLCTCVLFLWDLAASPTAGFGLDAGAVKRLVGCGPTQTCSIRRDWFSWQKKVKVSLNKGHRRHYCLFRRFRNDLLLFPRRLDPYLLDRWVWIAGTW